MMMKIVSMSVAVALAAQLVTAFGGQDVVTASSFGWNAEDATRCLQAALDSGAKKVIVDKQAGEWLVDTFYPRSDTEIVFADGVVIRAKSGTMKKTTDALVRFQRVTNVVFRGEGGAMLLMNRSDYLDPAKYSQGEHRHLLSIKRSVNLVIRDLTVAESGGDGIYVLGVENGLVENVTSVRNARQGMSIVNANGLTVRNCRFNDTKGALPECGIDFEPGHDTFNIENVTIEGCEFAGNACAGLAVNLSGFWAKNRPVSIVVRNCRMHHNRTHGFWSTFTRGVKPPVKGVFLMENCEFFANGSGPVQVENVCEDAVRMTFRNCTFDARGASGAAIEFSNGRVTSDLNNMVFENCRVLKGSSPVVAFGAMTGVGIVGLGGVLDVTTPEGRREQFDLAEFAKRFPPKPELREFLVETVDTTKLVPVDPRGQAAKWRVVPQNYRNGVSFVQYVEKPGEYDIDVSVAPIGKDTDTKTRIRVYDKFGTPHDAFESSDRHFVYKLKSAGGKTAYRLDIAANGVINVVSPYPGQGVVADQRVKWIGASGPRLYFWVKPGTENVKAEFTPVKNEWVSAELIAPDGTVRDSCERSDAGVILAAKRQKGAPGEIWQLHVVGMKEDCKLRLGAGTAGVYARDPALVLKTVE
ncbi:MAG: right-handed parallel beta-helix repeat-containing protein [Kiritimatiellae bacterium]|nr:right-handed parallel beta-helix repeat-containing protein [Kiritimatiellia bacterium]